MMNAESICTGLGEQRQLFALVSRFNTAPSVDLHSDYIPTGADEQLFRRLTESPRGERVLSHGIAEQHKLNDEGFWLFEEHRRRIALLSRESLELLMLNTGAAMHAREISGLIDRTRVSELKSAISECVYRFAVRRAELLVGNLGVKLAQTRKWPSDGPLPQRIRTVGADCLSMCLAGEPPVLLRRLRLKLPQSVAIEANELVSEQMQQRLWNVMRRILILEIDRELTACFN